MNIMNKQTQGKEYTHDETREREDKSKKVGSFLYIWKSVSRNPGAMIGLAFIILIVILSFLSTRISPHNFAMVDMMKRFGKPSMEHPFGNDHLGRDIFVRVLYGARYTLSIGLGATVIAAVGGILIGSLTGYFGGLLDSVTMRVIEVIQTFPFIVLAIALSAAFGRGLENCIYAIGISMMPVFVRLVRASFFAIRGSEYIEAATSINCPTFRIIFKHVLPNAISPIIVQISMSVASAGLMASSLSFLGLGVAEPNPEWGVMISSSRTFIRDYPHMVIFPGIFIMITVLSLNLIGDALRDALDPKLKD